MKKKLFSILLSLAVVVTMIPAAGSVAFAADGIVIAEAFPDANLRAAVSSFDSIGESDGVLSAEECAQATSIYLSTESNGDIADFTGLEKLTSLQNLEINGGDTGDGFSAKNLNVSTMPGLKQLVVCNTQVSDIDLSKNTELATLAIAKSPVSSVDVSKNTALGVLSVMDAPISELDVSNNANLTMLGVQGCNITSLDISALDPEKVGMIKIEKNAADVDLYVGCTEKVFYERNFFPEGEAISVSNNFKLEGTMKVKHQEVTTKGKAATCTATGLTDKIECSACGEVIQAQQTIAAKGHTPAAVAAKKATTSADGTTAGQKCSVCNAVIKAGQAVPAAKNVKLAAKTKVYTGKALKPAVTVKDAKGNAIAESNYTVSYANNKKVGKATATVTFKGNYTGTKALSFKINPKKAAVKSAAVGKKKITVKAATKVAATGGTKYKIAYKVKGASKWKYTTATSQSKVIKSLKKGKKYQVKIRAIKGDYVGAWSAVKTTKKVK